MFQYMDMESDKASHQKIKVFFFPALQTAGEVVQINDSKYVAMGSIIYRNFHYKEFYKILKLYLPYFPRPSIKYTSSKGRLKCRSCT
jgi:hypothetical protein